MIKWYSRKGFLSVETGNCYLNPLLDCLLTYMIGTYIPTCIWSFLHEDNLHLCEILVVSGHGLWTIVIVLKAFQFDSCNQWELCTFLYFFFKHTTHFMKVGLLVTSVIYNERVVDRLPAMTYGLKLSLEAWILKSDNFNLSFKEII